MTLFYLAKEYELWDSSRVVIRLGETIEDYKGEWFKIVHRTNKKYIAIHYHIIDNHTVEAYTCIPEGNDEDGNPERYHYMKESNPFKHFKAELVERLYNERQRDNKTDKMIFLTAGSRSIYKLALELISCNHKKTKAHSDYIKYFDEYVNYDIIEEFELSKGMEKKSDECWEEYDRLVKECEDIEKRLANGRKKFSWFDEKKAEKILVW